MPRSLRVIGTCVLLLVGCAFLLVGCDGAPASSDSGADAPMDCSDDGDCDDGLFCTGVPSCIAGRCAPGPAPCRTGQDCVEEVDHCFTICSVDDDADGDGARASECGGTDCDDSDPERFPGGAEVCDVAMHDEDCDPATFGFRDSDSDGSPDARCCNADEVGGTLTCGRDCDDETSGTHPGVPEVCNGIDDDCDAATDEDLVMRVTRDGDGDGHGDATEGAPTLDVCAAMSGWASLADDCDDADPARYPGNPELCDDAMLDEDCSGTGNDVAGGCDCTGTATEVCGALGRCAGATRTCADGTWGPCAVVPQTEVCAGDGADEDCDGSVDEGLTVTCYRDNDGDGYAADSASATPTCRSSAPGRADAPWNGCPSGFTGRAPSAGTDCCDSDARARPGATAYEATPRTCGGFDFDCNGAITTEHPAALNTCAALSSPCTNSDGSRNGWCTTAPTTCGQTGNWGSGCWFNGSACQATTCWPTPNRCR